MVFIFVFIPRLVHTFLLLTTILCCKANGRDSQLSSGLDTPPSCTTVYRSTDTFPSCRSSATSFVVYSDTASITYYCVSSASCYEVRSIGYASGSALPSKCSSIDDTDSIQAVRVSVSDLKPLAVVYNKVSSNTAVTSLLYIEDLISGYSNTEQFCKSIGLDQPSQIPSLLLKRLVRQANATISSLTFDKTYYISLPLCVKGRVIVPVPVIRTYGSIKFSSANSNLRIGPGESWILMKPSEIQNNFDNVTFVLNDCRRSVTLHDALNT